MKYILGYSPARLDEVDYTKAVDFVEANSMANKHLSEGGYTAWRTVEFDTEKEMLAYIDGVKDGIGWGSKEPIFFSKKEKSTKKV